MNKKICVGVATVIICAMLFLIFWKSTFAVASKEDNTLYIFYGCIAIVAMVLYYEIKKPVLNYILAIIFCIGTFVMLIMYRNWNREGFYINQDEIVSVTYYTDDGEEVDYTEFLDNISSKYNSAKCVKRWDNQGEPGTVIERINIEFKDGSKASIIYDYVYINGNIYRMNLNIKDLMK